MSAYHFTVTIKLPLLPDPKSEASIVCNASANSAVGTPINRRVRVPAACAAHSLARRRVADTLHVVGREQADVA